MVGLHWFGTRWLEFQTGYSQYLNFLFNFSNFILILYGLAPLIKDNIQFSLFVPIVVLTIIPLGIFVGNLHYNKQYRVVSSVGLKKNPYTYKIVPDSKEVVVNKAILTLLKEKKQSTLDPEIYKEICESIEEMEKLLSGEDIRNADK